MKMKDALTKIGEEVVYAVPNAVWKYPEIVTLVGTYEPGTVEVTKAGGYWSGSKNEVTMAKIRTAFTEKAVPFAHISNETPAEFRAAKADLEDAKIAARKSEAEERERMRVVEDRLVELGVIERRTTYDYENDRTVPSSRLRFDNSLNLSNAEIEALVALIPEEGS